MVYEVKIFKRKLITKCEIHGSVTIYKTYYRWVCISKECVTSKAFALSEIAFCLSMDKEEIREGVYFPEYKYSIRVLEGGKKRVKR